ncbi:hypothetical protein QUF99_15095 [Bacillus sp. DX4.1]|uniref:hypothetical protein n=1 Tax=Bacillus sp. DX4.1 TaxID=3055867 RepID=UPI0025A15D06|nr:hypothetical protein [Bacillus sp. DX4.1]MDM5188594.1 hypothetical protein [Bacillus sp. DX4.1]
MKDITAGRLQRLLANLNKEIAPLEAVFNEVDRKYHIRKLDGDFEVLADCIVSKKK